MSQHQEGTEAMAKIEHGKVGTGFGTGYVARENPQGRVPTPPGEGVPEENKLTPAEIEQCLVDNAEAMSRLAKKWSRTNARWVSPDEVLAAVTSGFFQAALRFDKSRGVKMITYGAWWAKKEIRDLLNDAKGLRRGGYLPPNYRPPASLNTERSFGRDYNGGDDCSLATAVPAREEQERPEFPDDFWERVYRCIPDQRSRDVINMRFKENLTLDEVGTRMGVTRERVRQMEDRVLAQLAGRCDFGSAIEAERYAAERYLPTNKCKLRKVA